MGESGSCFPERFLNLCLEVVKKKKKNSIKENLCFRILGS